MDVSDFGKVLIVLGVVLVALGGLVWAGSRLGLGRLPGDILLQGRGWTVYVPIATCILISVVLSLLLWLISRGRG